MLFEGTDPKPYITKYTLMHEDKTRLAIQHITAESQAQKGNKRVFITHPFFTRKSEVTAAMTPGCIGSPTAASSDTTEAPRTTVASGRPWAESAVLREVASRFPASACPR